jgi:hypothetical protein
LQLRQRLPLLLPRLLLPRRSCECMEKCLGLTAARKQHSGREAAAAAAAANGTVSVTMVCCSFRDRPCMLTGWIVDWLQHTGVCVWGWVTAHWAIPGWHWACDVALYSTCGHSCQEWGWWTDTIGSRPWYLPSLVGVFGALRCTW